MIRYNTNDTRVYFFMYMTSGNISHLETAIDRNEDFAFILCLEYRLMQEYKFIMSKRNKNAIEYKPLKIA